MKPKTPHKHAEVIKAWADGHQIQSVGRGCTLWCDEDDPSWSDFYEYRVKPEREYPETSLTDMELYEAFCTAMDSYEYGRLAIANAAIKRHEEDKERSQKEISTKLPDSSIASNLHEAFINGMEAAYLAAAVKGRILLITSQSSTDCMRGFELITSEIRLAIEKYK